jgi:iron-sulfur cluster assembly accessory protein
MCTHGITIEAVLNRSSTRLPDTGGVGFGQESIKESAMTTEATTTTTGIQLTDVAAAKVSALLAQEGRDDLNLRVAVQPGGCSGLKYQLYFDDRNMDGDIVREFGAVKVITDKMSDPYLSGATIDFVDTIEKQGFTIDNPQAQGSCACGDSFN